MQKTASIFAALVLVVLLSSGFGYPASISVQNDGQLAVEPGHVASLLQPASTDFVYLPIIQKPEKSAFRVNAPAFDGDVRFSESAIFWFGHVTPTENYADVRVGYNQDELGVRITAFDRRLWYDQTPASTDLTAWDAVSLYLNLDGAAGEIPAAGSYRLVAQLNWWETRENWQAGFRGDGTNWAVYPLSFSTESGWRGNAPNDSIDDRGWRLTFRVPFSSLGLSGSPSEGSRWGLAIVLHDRDDSSGTPIPDQTSPGEMDVNRPETWGQLGFGLPTYTPPPAAPGASVTIRHDLNGAVVMDAHVGGHTTCGQPYWPNFFDGWGDANYAGYDQINIQNQGDVADWPCFSKYYLTFPLDSVPPGKAIHSATLRMYQFGNAGQGAEPPPQPSMIQVLTVAETWDEQTITWNNASLAVENVSQAWVDPVGEFPGWPGIPWEWDVSSAVARAYDSQESLRLVLYSADAAQHSGKYFLSSDTGEWNSEGRPTLTILLADP